MLNSSLSFRKLVYTGRRFLGRIRALPSWSKLCPLVHNEHPVPVRLFVWYPVEMRPHIVALNTRSGSTRQWPVLACTMQALLSAARHAIRWGVRNHEQERLATYPNAVDNQGFKPDR